MNIALFLDCWTPMKNGVITSVQQLREGLEKRGHRVIIVTVKIGNHVPDDPQITVVPQIPLDFGSKQGFGMAMVSQKKVNQLLVEYKIDLIHSHTEFGIGLAAKKASRKLGIPMVSTAHTMWEDYSNYMFLLKYKKLIRGYLKYYLKQTRVLVTPSIKAEKYYNKFVPDLPKRVIPNGIDMNKFVQKNVTEADFAAVRETYRLDPNDQILIFVGRIGPEKRIEDLFALVLPLLKKRKNLKMVFVGDGPAYKSLVESAKANDVFDQVVFTGFVNWDAVYKLYSIADLFVTASLSEVHPMTLIEGAMCSLPSIARADDSYRDLIQPGYNGYLSESDEEMTANVEALLDDPEKLKTFSKNSLELSQKFTSENHVQRMLQLYADVLEGRVAGVDSNRG